MSLEFNKQNLQIASQELWTFLESKIKYLPKTDQEFVQLAFYIMVEKHAEQRRVSGDFYITHPVMAANLLTEIKIEKETLAACLLHDVPEDTFKDPTKGVKMIKKEFGQEVAFLVFGVTKLSLIKYQGEDKFAENLRKLFVAMSQDIRVIFIKLADRIHNLETLKSLHKDRPDKTRRIALESLEIYAPIAERLGISKFRSLIEDLAFPYAYPEEYKKFIQHPKLEIKSREKTVQKLIKKTNKILEKEKCKSKEILGRPKKYYSVFRKMHDENKTADKIFDLIALRIICPSIADCYQVLSVIHKNFDYMENRVKDYIKKPKTNGYQSIHTTVYDLETKSTFEFQIRTQKMHEFAEFGIASHWSYKQKSTTKDQEIKTEDFKWIRDLVDLGESKMPAQDYLKHVKLNVYQNRIFVLTPKGDAINLPKGATPIDFAFKIHGEIGEHASMAKINNQISKLNSKLKNGDIVEIITHKKQEPKQDWLGWVRSNSVSRQIKKILRDLQGEGTDKKVKSKK